MNARLGFRLAITAALLCGVAAFSQHGSGNRRDVGEVGGPASTSTDAMIQKIQIQAALQRNEQRQKSMVRDAEQLLRLANELNDAANNPNDTPSSPDMLKQAEEIEKLAKHVKDKMKGEY